MTFAGELAGRGVVVIDNGARRVTYEPVAAEIETGTKVSAGDVVGVMELGGSHCYPDACLHLGLIDDASDDYLDPLTLFASASDVRLLPLWAGEEFGLEVDLTRLFHSP
ncbi:hypothetical protein Back2_25130 [Nocardioides baekrokdamisoli]|uniref:Peptidase M23 domain-containing protein n=1 Tax=Nocardioides baekrokdamisoli TaxID=1804624 RepID=A0A3G9IIN4_9ACTN|nr:hypothetical protein Back2_25130 [Nocardioides baekrokdamisoli]